MDINISENIKQIIFAAILFIIPLIIIITCMIVGYENAILYIASITWFGTGVIFFGAIN